MESNYQKATRIMSIGSAFTGMGILAGVYMAYKKGGGFWRYAGFIIAGLMAAGVLFRLLFSKQIAEAAAATVALNSDADAEELELNAGMSAD